MKRLFTILLITPALMLRAQTQPAAGTGGGYWQQRVRYVMDVDVNAAANKFTGKQKLEYWNNSPDTLTLLFYHLYWNAFQPNSMMDVQSRHQGTVLVNGRPDWDGRVRDRILNLKPDEIGYQKVLSLKMNGRTQSFQTQETILQVKLDKPILPKTKVTLDLEFEAQVPVQIRRSGRDNAEGVRFSMSQWYPKLCEYDKMGWHPTPYVAREFYGVWGDYEVNISIDKAYTVAGTGYLQNAAQVGHGYEAEGTRLALPSGEKLLWRFKAPNVHDFVWAADPGYVHLKKKVRDGLELHAFYKIAPELLKSQYNALSPARKAELGNNPDNYIAFYKGQWDDVLDMMAAALPYIDRTFGKYPYNQYSFIQGGDGGMEYPMATLLKGAGPEAAIHEFLHSWYQGLLGTNESLYHWMDEGFATYAESLVYKELGLLRDTSFVHSDTYKAYLNVVKSGKEEPMVTHADHFQTNFAYRMASYIKGGVFMEQLGYITGATVRDRILLEYFLQWKFRHPDPDDLLKIAEKQSGLKLDWYKEYWVNSTKTIDYAIDSLWETGGKTRIRVRRAGLMPMPVDLQLTFRDSTRELHYVPLELMYGVKPAENAINRKVYPAWNWTDETYIIETDRRLMDIAVAEIDPSQRMADVERKNNRLKL